MLREVSKEVRGYRTQDGAGVSLVRVLGNGTVDEYDPFLMLDAFDSTDPKDYVKGFPTHPHRGIETFTFLSKGGILHEDHLGTKELIGDGEAQWLTAGSGAYHSEMPQPSERMLGVQLWLNMPADKKMVAPPYYEGVMREDVKQIPLKHGVLRLMAGEYKGEKGIQGKYLPLNFYDILLKANGKAEIELPEDFSAFAFTLLGDAIISGKEIKEKTAAKLTQGDRVEIEAKEQDIEILVISSKKLGEPIQWYGPVVMNTREQIITAITEMENGNFIKQSIAY